jgi:hypothetical protein
MLNQKTNAFWLSKLRTYHLKAKAKYQTVIASHVALKEDYDELLVTNEKLTEKYNEQLKKLRDQNQNDLVANAVSTLMAHTHPGKYKDLALLGKRKQELLSIQAQLNQRNFAMAASAGSPWQLL